MISPERHQAASRNRRELDVRENVLEFVKGIPDVMAGQVLVGDEKAQGP